jgi:hypothetical protein
MFATDAPGDRQIYLSAAHADAGGRSGGPQKQGPDLGLHAILRGYVVLLVLHRDVCLAPERLERRGFLRGNAMETW